MMYEILPFIQTFKFFFSDPEFYSIDYKFKSIKSIFFVELHWRKKTSLNSIVSAIGEGESATTSQLLNCRIIDSFGNQFPTANKICLSFV